MSMRSQVYSWNGANFNPAASNSAGTTNYSVGNALSGRQISIFIGGFGNNITMPAETTATEFVVIEDVACTPTLNATAGVCTGDETAAVNTQGAAALMLSRGQLFNWTCQNNNDAGAAWAGASAGLFGPRMYVQVRINTTDYFLNPDNVTNDGIPGTASPYPRSLDMQPSFNLYPDVYVLPGQVWDVRVTSYCQDANFNTDVANTAGYLGNWGKVAAAGVVTPIAGAGGPEFNGIDFNAFVKYTLYDGPDALIANKLLEMGISINPGNVDWYKRSLLSAQ